MKSRELLIALFAMFIFFSCGIIAEYIDSLQSECVK